MLGEVSDEELVRLYAQSDFLLHPSAVEVLPGTVLEALAAGLPIVGGPAIEGVVEEGTTGWSLPDTDPAMFVTAMRERVTRLVADDRLRREMGDRGRSVAESRFAWPRVVEEHLRVYASVGAGRAPT
jgi:glycosyltransferase involved in cell wall biosynthesis